MARRPNSHLEMVQSRRVPKPSGATSAAVLVVTPGDTLYIAGLLPREAPKGAMCAGPIRRQAEVTFGALRLLLSDAGFAMEDLAQSTLHITDLKHMAIVDEVWRKQFVGQGLPARTVVQVAALEEGALLCVSGVAVKRAAELAPPAAPGGEDPYGEPMY